MELKDVSSAMQNDAEVVAAAVANKAEALQYASATMQCDVERAISAIQRAASRDLFRSLCSTAKGIKPIALAAARVNGLMLGEMSSSLQSDEEVVVAAVTQNGDALRYAARSLRAVKSIALIAVNRDGMELKDVSGAMQNDAEVVAAAVHQNVWAIQHASSDLRADRTIAIIVVQREGLCLQYLSSALRGDMAIAVMAVRQNKLAFQHVDKSLYGCAELLGILNAQLRFRFTGNYGIPLPFKFWPTSLTKDQMVSKQSCLACTNCAKQFSILTWRHHCRMCGGLFCCDCSPQALAMLDRQSSLPIGPQRTCGQCFAKSRLLAQQTRSICNISTPFPAGSGASERFHHLLMNQCEIPPVYFPFLDLLTGVDPVIVIDDSGSMKFPANPDLPQSNTRWVEMQSIVFRMLAVFDLIAPSSIDVFFMNRNRHKPVVATVSVLQALFDQEPPFGGTPTVATLQRVFAAKVREDSPRPVVIYLFTDGEPDGSFKAFEAFLDDRPCKRNSLLSIVLCTDEEPVVEMYRRLENQMVMMRDGVWNALGIPGVDVTEDYYGEARDVKRLGRTTQLTQTDYLVKLLAGPLDAAVHLLDLPAKPVFWTAPVSRGGEE